MRLLSRRSTIACLAIAIPLEGVSAAFLRYVPRVGVPRDSDPVHRLGGDLTALAHAPWLILSDYLCAKFCPPRMLLDGIVVVGGYLDIAVMLGLLAVSYRLLRKSRG